jgi:YaiO family outer membrane protein
MRSFRLILLCACVLLLPLYATAQTQPAEPRPEGTPDPQERTAKTEPAKKIEPETVVELGASYEFVNNDNPDWQTYYWSINHKFSTGQVLYGTASAVRRFETTDPNFMIGYVQPFTKSKRWITTFEASVSPNHEILPTTSFFGQVERVFNKGWVGRAGLRHSRYPADIVNMGIFGAEKYFKAYRGAYTLYVAHLNGKGTALSHVIQGNYYYGERNSVGAGFAFGQEIESVPGGLIKTNVLDLSFTGRHWMTNKWGVSYVVLWHRQGDFYTRSGAQIGFLLRL